MKKAFTMIELIFVIILISIISSVGIGFIPNYDLQNDTNFILMNIKEKQKNALNNDINSLGAEFWEQPIEDSDEYNLTCVKFTKDSLEKLDIKNSYTIKSSISSVPTLCFDFLGRPYEYNDTLNSKVQLLLVNIDINVTKNNNSKNISVYPMSGYAKINEK